MTGVPSDAPLLLHATTVSVEGQGILILGPSGAGKSTLALQLIALGALLVSDDQTQITVQDTRLIASAPAPLFGLIEARGVGILRVAPADPTPLSLAVDLSQSEPERLPNAHTHCIADITLPCLWGVTAPYFAPAILLYVQGGLGEAP